jgi:hypothetical protein
VSPGLAGLHLRQPPSQPRVLHDVVATGGVGISGQGLLGPAQLAGQPTTPRSAWNCANDDSNSLRERSRPSVATKFTAMLYDGRNDDLSGYVRVDASPAT